MRKLARAVVLASAFILSLTSAQQAWAWDSPGHMAVAYLAWNQLTPAQQTRVSLLLRSNPYYKKWNGWLKSANVPKADHDRDIFMLAATWPDEIKSDSKYKGTDSIPKGTSTPESGAYGDGHTHKYWHFVDTPYSRTTLHRPTRHPRRTPRAKSSTSPPNSRLPVSPTNRSLSTSRGSSTLSVTSTSHCTPPPGIPLAPRTAVATASR